MDELRPCVDLRRVPSVDDPWFTAAPVAPGVAAAERYAADHDFVVSRTELTSFGVNDKMVQRQIAAGRWAALGLHAVAAHRGPLSEGGLWRYALHEVGSNGALDGVSALRAGGLQGFEDIVSVSVLHGWRPRRIPGVMVKELRGWDPADVLDVDLRRVRPALAAIRAATWLRTRRQAALVLVMPVQQGLVRGTDLLAAIQRFRRLPRRALIEGVVADIVSGAESLGEIDFARECRRRGLPEPGRQAVRRGRRGRVYLDVYFDRFRLVVEIEGAHHDRLLNAIDDSLRQNELAVDGQEVLRIPVVGFRLQRDAFMQQVARALRRHGWRG